MVLRGGFVLVTAMVCLSAQPDPKTPLRPDVILLARVRNVAAETFAHLPNYTCTMTIERSYKRANSDKYVPLDILRLEVALVDKKELFAWPGATKFEEKELADMVGGAGATSTGDFGGHANSIVLSPRTSVTYAGKESLDGKEYHRFSFKRPASHSGLTIRLGGAEGDVGYSGSFWVDPITVELHRIEFTVDEIPPQLPLKTSTNVIEYQSVRIGETDFLLPASSELQMTVLNGQTDRNRTTFSNCRQFAGESTLIFDEPAPDSPAAPADEPWKLPQGLRVELRTAAAVDMRKVAIGDQIELIVARNVKQQDKVWLPKGAKVMARLTDYVCTDSPYSACIVTIKPETFRFEGRHGDLLAEIEQPVYGRTPMSGRGSVTGPASDLGLYLMLVARMNRTPPGAGHLLFRGSRLVNGSLSVWRTLEVRE